MGLIIKGTIIFPMNICTVPRGSMGRTVYFLTWMDDFYGKLIGKYASPVDPLGYIIYIYISIHIYTVNIHLQLTFHPTCLNLKKSIWTKCSHSFQSSPKDIFQSPQGLPPLKKVENQKTVQFPFATKPGVVQLVLVKRASLWRATNGQF